MSHPNPSHDRDNERVEDSKFAPKKQTIHSPVRHPKKFKPMSGPAKLIAMANRMK